MIGDAVLNGAMCQGVSLLRINRPTQGNALNREVLKRLREYLEKLDNDDRVKVVVLTGEGEKFFCAGIDLKERSKMKSEEIPEYREKIIKTCFDAFHNFHKPIIAAVNGVAYGGGAELALACDFRIASINAKFAQSEIKWGIMPACGGCQRLKLIAGLGRAKELILTGRIIESHEAMQYNIYNSVVAPDLLMNEVETVASEMANYSMIALMQAKKALQMGTLDEESIGREFDLSKACYDSGGALSKAGEFGKDYAKGGTE